MLGSCFVIQVSPSISSLCLLNKLIRHRFERNQFLEVRDQWATGVDGHKNAGDTYGAEHFCRLIGESFNTPIQLLFF